MIKTTCDRCGEDISDEGHWQIRYVKPPSGPLLFSPGIDEVRNTFCTNCW